MTGPRWLKYVGRSRYYVTSNIFVLFEKDMHEKFSSGNFKNEHLEHVEVGRGIILRRKLKIRPNSDWEIRNTGINDVGNKETCSLNP
jgi:hypothetical protein